MCCCKLMDVKEVVVTADLELIQRYLKADWKILRILKAGIRQDGSEIGEYHLGWTGGYPVRKP